MVSEPHLGIQTLIPAPDPPLLSAGERTTGAASSPSMQGRGRTLG